MHTHAKFQNTPRLGCSILHQCIAYQSIFRAMVDCHEPVTQKHNISRGSRLANIARYHPASQSLRDAQDAVDTAAHLPWHGTKRAPGKGRERERETGHVHNSWQQEKLINYV